MPKVHLTDEDKDFARLCENLRLLECGRTVREMAKIAGMSKTTYSQRRQNPDTFTYREIYRLCRAAGVDVSDFTGGKLRLKGE